jgi:hypothetical protein
LLNNAQDPFGDIDELEVDPIKASTKFLKEFRDMQA